MIRAAVGKANTLVVDVRNFSDAMNYRGAGQNLHLVERFTRVGANDLRYEVTVEDATHVREAVDGGAQSEDAAGGDVRVRVPRRATTRCSTC